jgi:hypothetical protein
MSPSVVAERTKPVGAAPRADDAVRAEIDVDVTQPYA